MHITGFPARIAQRRPRAPAGAEGSTVSMVHEEPVVGRDQVPRFAPVTLPEAVPPPPRRWPGDEWALIRRGHRAQDMDDKWNALVEDDRLFLHRSWTGRGIYEAPRGP